MRVIVGLNHIFARQKHFYLHDISSLILLSRHFCCTNCPGFVWHVDICFDAIQNKMTAAFVFPFYMCVHVRTKKNHEHLITLSDIIFLFCANWFIYCFFPSIIFLKWCGHLKFDDSTTFILIEYPVICAHEIVLTICKLQETTIISNIKIITLISHQ